MPHTPLGLYIHFPFCLRKCPYCDFNSHVAQGIDHSHWAEAFVCAIQSAADNAQRQKHKLHSIFIGGGTPSLMAPATVERILTTAKQVFGFEDGIEITMEANPTSVEAQRLGDFAAAGINRLSMGIQALDDTALTFLGRGHSAGEALAALGVARGIFPRISADFIYARPGQDKAAWDRELGQILALNLTHLSLYQLTIERGTAFWNQHKTGVLTLPPDDTARALFDLTQKRCDAAGLPAYEISNHAAGGEECRHNLIYWRAGDWLGVGPGAYGRYWLDGRRTQTQDYRNPSTWLEQAQTHGMGTESIIHESEAQAQAEIAMMGLRLAEGIEMGRLKTINQARLAILVKNGFVIREGGRIRLSPSGIPLANSIIAELLY